VGLDSSMPAPGSGRGGEGKLQGRTQVGKGKLIVETEKEAKIPGKSADRVDRPPDRGEKKMEGAP